MDLVTAAWERGSFDASIASHRIEKDSHPYRITHNGEELPAIHYLYPLEGTDVTPDELLNTIRPSVRSIHCLGWGIDQVIADATLVGSLSHQPGTEKWSSSARDGKHLRVHRTGSFDALIARHGRFLNRVVRSEWTPVPPMSEFDQIPYRRDSDPMGRPAIIFKLVDDNEDTVTYPQSKLIHIAGMVRHLAIERMERNPPRDLRGRGTAEWLEAYVAGHQSSEDKAKGAQHSQFSYIPLQSIGNAHVDPSVRRVMIVAPLGDEAWLEHLAEQLDGAELKPLPNTSLPPKTRLERVANRARDGVRDAYLGASVEWASVSPVILPGRDDHQPNKTRKLILKALAQSGIDQPCEFEWSSFSQFRKMLPAHKYRKDPNDPAKKIRINYVRPDHLLEMSAVHLALCFGRREDPLDAESRWIPAEVPVPGPIVIGAGRHCGFGLMAVAPGRSDPGSS